MPVRLPSLRLLGVASAACLLSAPAAAALPLVDLGGGAGAAIHFPGGNPAIDLTAQANVLGFGVSAQYWKQFGTTNQYMQAVLSKNVSPVPGLEVSPGVGVASLCGCGGGVVNTTAVFRPLLLPVSFEAMLGAGWAVNDGFFVPYAAGVKWSPLPFTSLVARYRGWGAGAAKLGAGPEIGLEVGI